MRTNWQEEEAADEESILVKHEDDIRNVNQKTPDGSIVRLDAPKSDRSTEYHPLMVPMNHDLNNDIYFIGKRREGVKYDKRINTIDTLIDTSFLSAIVAGCSAAAMFALVLISLTWCR